MHDNMDFIKTNNYLLKIWLIHDTYICIEFGLEYMNVFLFNKYVVVYC